MNTLPTRKNIRTYSHNARLISQRRLQIIKSAQRLFAKKGYAQTSTREIASACKMTIGSLYYYIGSKQDILQMMVDSQQQLYTKSYTKSLNDVKSKTNTEALTYAFGKMVREMEKQRYFIIFLWREMSYLPPQARKTVLSYEDNITTQFEKLLRLGCEQGEFKIQNIKLVANDILFASEMWALRRWLIEEFCTIDDYIEHEIKRILDNIRAR
ncbi:MAG: TetR/AcrR family transcriptional regulator [Dehalococcoidia bacterium]|nr:TetR/AcrR family transcriptional regulator [Dehalococcoidia bacterium]